MREGVDGARGGHADHHEEKVGHGEVQNELRRSIESFDAACGVTAALGIFQRLSLPERSKINWPELDWTERQRQQQQRRTSIPRPRFVVLRICLLKVTTSTTSRLPKNPMKTTIAKNMGTVEQAES